MINIGKNIKKVCDDLGIKRFALTETLVKRDAQKLADIYVKFKEIESELYEVEEDLKKIENNYSDFPVISKILQLCIHNIVACVSSLNDTDRKILKDAHKIINLKKETK